jgi:NAD(P)-dependent dehydrogenase (short-subunit alcohol dehydrogenase family)
VARSKVFLKYLDVLSPLARGPGKGGKAAVDVERRASVTPEPKTPETRVLELRGKVAVVTGGGGGLGSALGATFAREGMAVALLDIDEAAAKDRATAIGADFGVPTTAWRVDVGDAGSIEGARDHVRTTLGGCDVLCANVGVQQFGALDRLTEHDWEWVLNVNVLGTIRTVRSFLPEMRVASGWRRILLTASSCVLAPSVRMGAYQTSKFAVTGFGETLRAELAPEGIGVTILFPAGMMTGHLDSSARARPAVLTETGAEEDDLSEMMAHTPMTPEDLATPEHAVRNLMADLLDNEPYSVTHGTSRPFYTRRRDALEAAFDRMEAS